MLNTLRAHHDRRRHRDLKGNFGDALARAAGKDIELQIARALERRSGLGDAANLSADLRPRPSDASLDAGFTGAIAGIVRYDNRNGRFDITFEIGNENGSAAPSCALPERRSRPSRPPCWRAPSSAMRS